MTKKMGFERTVEQDPDRITWDLNKWQNRFMTKKVGFEQTVEQNWTKKDAYLKNGRLGFGQEQYQVETEKDEGPTNGRLGFRFLHLQLSLMRFRIMTEKDGV